MLVLRREDIEQIDRLVIWLYDVLEDSEPECTPVVLYDWESQVVNVVVGDFIVVPEGAREISREHELGTLDNVLSYVADHCWFCFEYADLLQDLFASLEEIAEEGE